VPRKSILMPPRSWAYKPLVSDNGWTARVIRNEDDGDGVVEMIKDQEPKHRRWQSCRPGTQRVAMDQDPSALSRAQLIAEAWRLHKGIRQYQDSLNRAFGATA
jgi:hypothetical protein